MAVDRRDVCDWSLAALRATIGYVEQDAPVLAGAPRDNLRFAALDAGDAEIRAVVERTRLDGLLRLPGGLDTHVGYRGITLSGGEGQRVAIARALLRGPRRLLLLDEATSQLDAVNELALRDVIAAAARTTTVLVIAHRLSTVSGADHIVVMNGGAPAPPAPTPS